MTNAGGRPVTFAFTEAATAASWKTKPAWGIVSAADRTINPEVERFGYRRAGLRKVVELDAPHLVMHTHPDEVTAEITGTISELS
ncbi:alpha/beta fold hydrolase [Nocardia seriolae]|uniref:alpha/beta fold hydrolase n=1 Tax=Nocardia seriolae TaxID=37332 RepID=UPI0003F3D051|nr:alpha/beta hydrolase [Nocardia seriolae]